MSLISHERKLQTWWADDLQRHGIRVHSRANLNSQQTIYRTWHIPVFALDALGIFSAQGQAQPLTEIASVNNILRTSRSHFLQIVMRLAIRVVYVLGLKYGVVMITRSEAGLPVVSDLQTSLRNVHEPMHNRLKEAMQSARVRLTKVNSQDATTQSMKLGLDIEFILRQPGANAKIVPASRFLKRNGQVGCDSVRIGGKLYYPLAELRPSPAAEPQELFRNLYAAMRKAAMRIGDASLEWLAGGMPAQGLPLGGHIHVSGVPLNADLLRAMDNYMALPLVLLEDSTTSRRRRAYGALGDFRRQFHGGFEYRTLPSWIVSPALAMGVIALARVIVEHYSELRQRPLARPEMQTAYYVGDKLCIQPVVPALWEDLEATSAYKKYEPALDWLKRATLRMKSWNEQRDLRVAWKIPPYHKIMV
jgi:hypothetical protein